MKKTKEQKAITLIALIITIVVLLILAVVAIRAVQGDGILSYAKNARDDYQAAQDEEEAQLQNYLDILNKENGNGGKEEGTGTETITVAQAQEKGVLSTSATTDVKDEYGNIVRVPAGFKITTDASKVTEGIVIEDCTTAATNGSQFVWIPVGTVYTNAEQTSSETIDLNRYKFASDGTPSPQGNAEIEIDQELATSTYGNATAKDLNGFLTSTKSIQEGGNGGYYLGRYEAGTETARSSEDDELTQLIVKSNVNVYDYVTQLQASSLSQGMYANNKETNVISDLINSYAWDTAIVFIQTFSTNSDASTYSQLNKSTNCANTGINPDRYCNIYDMSGNAYEWSTETCNSDVFPCVYRGGSYDADYGFAWSYTRDRFDSSTSYSSPYFSFRPLLYW